MSGESRRPAVSVVMPFAGSASDAAAAVAQLEGLAIREGDELIVADNSVGGVVGGAERVTVVRAGELASSYYARNVGARGAANEWLLFVDSDCLLPPDLIDAYFDTSPSAECGLLAGEVEGDADQDSTIARYHRSRGHLHAAAPLATGPSPAVGTANALVRAQAWRELEGFDEVVSGADFEFAWRAGAHGWGVEYRPAARVGHRHPETLAAMRAKARRYGAGQRWLERRYPGVPRRPSAAREVLRGAAGIAVWGLTGRFERACFKALDAIWITSYARGWRGGKNGAKALGSA